MIFFSGLAILTLLAIVASRAGVDEAYRDSRDPRDHLPLWAYLARR